MPISAENIGKSIIRGFSQGGSVSFQTPYLGLFTTLPGADGTGGVEVSYPEYKRVAINVNGIEGKKIMVDPYTEAGSGADAGKTITATKNQEIIYFPEAETGAGGTAVGFGLFSAQTGGNLYLWGELKSGVTISQYSVPMFRADGFMLKLK